MTFSWHSFSGNCRSHCVEANLAWFHTLSRWSHQMPKSKHPVREQVTSQRLCLNVTQNKPAQRPLGSQTAHRRSRIIWPWHIIVRVRLCVCARVCDVWSCLHPGNGPYFCSTVLVRRQPTTVHGLTNPCGSMAAPSLTLHLDFELTSSLSLLWRCNSTEMPQIFFELRMHRWKTYQCWCKVC